MKRLAIAAIAALAAGAIVAGAVPFARTYAQEATDPAPMPPPAIAPPPAAVPPPVAAPAPAEAMPPAVTSPPAAKPAPEAEDSRYTFHRVQDSFVRLDGRTGQVSVCGRETAGWACRAEPDERSALEETIGRLQNQSAALKKELLARGLPLPSGVRADLPEPKVSDKPDKKPDPNPTLKMPSDAELDRVMGFIEKVWRRLVEMMVDLQRDIQRKS